MDVVLIILGVLGLGAIIISVYVFTVSARNYVSSDEQGRRRVQAPPARKHLVQRRATDRRSGKQVVFPLTVNGVVVPEDRRHLPDRRKAA